MLGKNTTEEGKAIRLAAPLSAKQIIQYRKSYLVTSSVEVRNIILHTFMLVTIHTGMCYDEAREADNEPH